MNPLYPRGRGERGFVALTSTIIIAAVLLILMYGTSTGGFYSRGDALGGEFKRTSSALSEACTNAALLKIAENYEYSPIAPEQVQVGSSVNDVCFIRSVTYDNREFNGAGAEIKKRAIITTIAQYPAASGSWSTNKITATVANPQISVAIPPPTCILQASPSAVQAGKPITVQWSASSNATSFTLTPTPTPVVNNPGEAQIGIRTYTATGAGTVTYTGVASNAGGSSNPCIATITVTPPPPAPSCADTVLMLDRTLTMHNDTTAFQAERDAAKAFLNQYVNAVPPLNPFPYTGVGSFRGTDGSNALVPVSGRLTNTNNYSSLYTTIDSIYSSNSNNAGTDLGAAISKAQSELLTRGLATAKKVLVFMSDGDLTGAEPNGNNSMTDWLNAADAAKNAGIQIFTIAYSADSAGMTRLAQLASGNTPFPANDTGFLSPDSETHSANDSGSAWGNANNAERNGNGAATAINNTNSRERYYDFNIPTISGNVSINDIQIKTDAWVTGATENIVTENFGPTPGVNDIPNWDEAGGPSATTVALAPTSNGNDSASPDGGRFAKIAEKEWICREFDASQFNTLRLSYYWRGDADSSSSSDDGIVEYKGGSGDCGEQNGWTTLQNHDLRSDSSWNNQGAFALPTSLGGTTFRLRFRNNNSGNNGTEHFRIDGVVLSGINTNNLSCQLGVDLSWAAGANGTWSSEQTVTLPGVESSQILTVSTGSGWGSHLWTGGEFTNNNFRARVRAIGSGSCNNAAITNLDWIQVRVLYGAAHQPGSANDQGGNATLENAAADGDNFFIAPTPTDMANIFKIVGQKVCPALASACSNTIDDDGDGKIDSADPSCHVGDVMSGAYDPNDNDEWTPPPIPPAPTPPPPPPPVSITGWDEVISTSP